MADRLSWLLLCDPDLSKDGEARWVIKNEVVRVEFAAASGELRSAVGVNRYRAGDALLTGSTGDRWCVSRDRFDAKYRPDSGQATGAGGNYHNVPTPILAKQMSVPFRVARTMGGDVLEGDAGDWLMQYAPGDHGIVARARFDRVYREAGSRS